MSTISKSLSGFIFNGAALALASASWKSKVRIIYGFNPGGTGYISFKPTSQFNSLTQLVQDGMYIIDVSTTGFDIPGATLTASVPGVVSPLSFSSFAIINRVPISSGNPNAINFNFRYAVASTDAGDTHFSFLLCSDTSVNEFTVHVLDSTITYTEGLPGEIGKTYKVVLVSNNGNTAVTSFTL